MLPKSMSCSWNGEISNARYISGIFSHPRSSVNLSIKNYMLEIVCTFIRKEEDEKSSRKPWIFSLCCIVVSFDENLFESIGIMHSNEYSCTHIPSA
jgi:hypothetical protein